MKKAGYFFFLDESSELAKNLVKFRYIGVTLNPHGDEAYEGLEYPVYCVLNPHSIDFYFHGDKTPYDHPDQDKDRTVNEKLFSLPLSINLQIKDNLTAHLKYYYNQYIVLGDKCQISGIDEDQAVYYSNLSAIKPKYLEENGNNILYFRQLILDFLFDLEHSEVFKNSFFYEDTEAKLKENFHLSAIQTKAEYYYTRHKYLDEEFETINDQKKGIIYGRKLIDKEKAWLNCIKNLEAPTLFNQSDWFCEVEEEYRNVFFNWRPNNKDGKKSNSFNIKRFFKNTVKQRDEWLNQIFDYLNSNKKGDENNPDLTEQQVKFRKAELKDTRKANKDALRESVKWFLRRYDLCTCYRLILQDVRSGTLRLGILVLFLLVGLGALFYAPPIQNQVFKNITGLFLFFGNIYGLLLLILFGSLGRLAPIVGMTLPRMVMAITSSWLLFLNAEELWIANFDRPLDPTLFLIVLVLIVIGFCFLYVEVRNLAPHIKAGKLILRITVVLAIGLFYSLFVGSLATNNLSKNMLARSGYLSKYCKHVDTAQKANYAVVESNGLKDSLNTILNQNEKASPKEDRLYDFIVKQPVKVSKDKHEVAFTLPLQIFLSEKTPWQEWLSWRLHIFPGFLLFYSVLALFVGVFIQLIFEDKPVTEPL